MRLCWLEKDLKYHVKADLKMHHTGGKTVLSHTYFKEKWTSIVPSLQKKSSKKDNNPLTTNDHFSTFYSISTSYS